MSEIHTVHRADNPQDYEKNLELLKKDKNFSLLCKAMNECYGDMVMSLIEEFKDNTNITNTDEDVIGIILENGDMIDIEPVWRGVLSRKLSKDSFRVNYENGKASSINTLDSTKERIPEPPIPGEINLLEYYDHYY